ncbi:uncharacterized protein [Takifugu rubripes]|uniref:uncharacterized protein n=1 Tax=Takifugu rubripes TaxID=31033 RepID=UPI0005D1591E|nr:uncharacterized protein LOC105418611 [Takifugu rubripes]|eukprot:XP_011616729.1 PREDICTED: uncharacterized protein LOC105418611 [Takifugu rubripes]
MAYRRRRQLNNSDHSDVPSTVEQLSFKYMEMCKVESSTDSDSEISPRWSDTSTLGCMSSTPETPTLKLMHKPRGRHDCSLLLDPYDGSSEDSDESDLTAPRRWARRSSGAGGGSCRFLGKNRRFLLLKSGCRDPASEQPLLDVQMTCESEAELWLCEIDLRPSDGEQGGGVDLEESTVRAQTMDVQLLDDSGVHAPLPSTVGPGNLPDSSSERSPSPCLYKRKMCFPGAEVSELGQRKRQRVPSMEEGASASQPGLSHVNTD